MGNVHFDLINSWCLANMVPKKTENGVFTKVELPDYITGPATYMIVNEVVKGSQNDVNRYIGVTGDLKGRFNPRCQVVFDLGLPEEVLERVHVVWGKTYVKNTNEKDFREVIAKDSFVVKIDGGEIDLETLLIRFVVTQFGAGGIVSNTRKAFSKIENPTGDRLGVKLSWKEFGGFPTGEKEATMNDDSRW